MKKTAVEWLIGKIAKHYIINNGILDPTVVMELKRQAKAIHKQEIIDAYETSHISMMTAEQYYNETFNNKA